MPSKTAIATGAFVFCMIIVVGLLSYIINQDPSKTTTDNMIIASLVFLVFGWVTAWVALTSTLTQEQQKDIWFKINAGRNAKRPRPQPLAQ